MLCCGACSSLVLLVCLPNSIFASGFGLFPPLLSGKQALCDLFLVCLFVYVYSIGSFSALNLNLKNFITLN